MSWIIYVLLSVIKLLIVVSLLLISVLLLPIIVLLFSLGLVLSYLRDIEPIIYNRQSSLIALDSLSLMKIKNVGLVICLHVLRKQKMAYTKDKTIF